MSDIETPEERRRREEWALLNGPIPVLDRATDFAELIDRVEALAHHGPPGSWLWDLLEVLRRVEAEVQP